MSQLHVGNQQFFRQYSPDSELPLENRVFTTEYEQARRQRGFGAQVADFSSPMQFDISMNNELYFLRSCNLRLPINAAFVDEFGNQIRSPEEVACLAVRNRPERAFNQIETNLNGFRSNRRPDDMSWGVLSHRRRVWSQSTERGRGCPNQHSRGIDRSTSW